VQRSFPKSSKSSTAWISNPNGKVLGSGFRSRSFEGPEIRLLDYYGQNEHGISEPRSFHLYAQLIVARNPFSNPADPPRYVVPLGVRALLADAGIPNVVELDWWESTTVGAAEGPMEIVLTPVQHWSGRRLDDRMRTLWGGYALFTPGFNVYFAGDTGYSPDFADTRARYASRGGFDLALLPIGAYEPRWFMQLQHMNPDEAVLAHRDQGARATLGIHWGTFELTDEPLDQPPRDLAAALRAQAVPAERFWVVKPGETRTLQSIAPSTLPPRATLRTMSPDR